MRKAKVLSRRERKGSIITCIKELKEAEPLKKKTWLGGKRGYAVAPFCPQKGPENRGKNE